MKFGKLKFRCRVFSLETLYKINPNSNSLQPRLRLVVILSKMLKVAKLLKVAKVLKGAKILKFATVLKVAEVLAGTYILAS